MLLETWVGEDDGLFPSDGLFPDEDDGLLPDVVDLLPKDDDGLLPLDEEDPVRVAAPPATAAPAMTDGSRCDVPLAAVAPPAAAVPSAASPSMGVVTAFRPPPLAAPLALRHRCSWNAGEAGAPPFMLSAAATWMGSTPHGKRWLPLLAAAAAAAAASVAAAAAATAEGWATRCPRPPLASISRVTATSSTAPPEAATPAARRRGRQSYDPMGGDACGIPKWRRGYRVNEGGRSARTGG